MYAAVCTFICAVFAHELWPVFLSVGCLGMLGGKADVNQILWAPTGQTECWSEVPGQLHSLWLKNKTDDLTFFDTGLLETRCGSKLTFVEAEYYKYMFLLFHCCSD